MQRYHCRARESEKEWASVDWDLELEDGIIVEVKVSCVHIWDNAPLWMLLAVSLHSGAMNNDTNQKFCSRKTSEEK